MEQLFVKKSLKHPFLRQFMKEGSHFNATFVVLAFQRRANLKGTLQQFMKEEIHFSATFAILALHKMAH